MDKDLFVKYLNNDCSPEELNEVLDWFRDHSVNFVEKEKVKHVWDEFEVSGKGLEPDESEVMLDKIHHRRSLEESSRRKKEQIVYLRKKPYHNLFNVLTRVAAVLFIPVLITLLYIYSSGKLKPVEYTENIIEIQVPAGSVIRTELPDGTKVWVNQKSTLKYPQKFERNCRKVYLEGEAYFDVAGETERPFIAAVNGIEVKATGTEFNVRAYPGDLFIHTTLVSGRVNLASRSTRNTDLQTICEMYPGQHMTIDLNTNTYDLKKTYVENYVSWKDGKLVFKEATLKHMLERLGSWNNIEFVLLDKELEDLTYTATFIDETLPQMLDLLEKAAPVRFRTSRRERMEDGSYSKSKIYVSYRR